MDRREGMNEEGWRRKAGCRGERTGKGREMKREIEDDREGDMGG